MWIIEVFEGSELVVASGSYSGETLADDDISPEAEAIGRERARRIFRVWDWLRAYPSRWPAELPLTDSARAAQQQWNPDEDDAAKRCVPPGMPRAMSNNGLPIEFVDEGDRILMRLEEFDAVRTIHLTRETPGAEVPASPLGHSIGWWEDQTLVVHTSRINYPYFDRDGIPQSADVEIVERFTLSDNEDELGYRIRLTDPVIFTAPVEASKRWVWRPGLALRNYDCAFIE